MIIYIIYSKIDLVVTLLIVFTVFYPVQIVYNLIGGIN